MEQREFHLTRIFLVVDQLEHLGLIQKIPCGYLVVEITTMVSIRVLFRLMYVTNHIFVRLE